MVDKEWELDRSLHNSSLTLKLHHKEIEEYQIKMMQNNNIPNLIKLQNIRENNISILKYPIINKLTIYEYGKQYLISYEILKGLIEALIETMESLNEYFLDEENLLISGDKMFIDVMSKELKLIYLPTVYKNTKGIVEIKKLIIELFKYIHKGDEKAIALIHKLKIIMEEECSSIFSFKAILSFEEDMIHKGYLSRKVVEDINEEDRYKVSKKEKKSLSLLRLIKKG